MGYWAYMNHGARTATVHSGDCPHCKHGFGPKWEGDTRAGRWDGPHGSWEAAFSTARDTTRRRYQVKWCAHCRPENPWGPVGNVRGAARSS